MSSYWQMIVSVAACVASLAVPVFGTAAQDDPAAEVQLAEEPTHDRSFIGRQIARIALMDLRQQQVPGPDDAAIAAELLEIAAEFRPEDTTVLRLLIEARRAAGDDRGVMRSTRSLLRLDPDDEIALLRLIAWQISQRQTVEQRLAGYEFWLDGAGATELAGRPAVLSRLAMDAALLQRELGNERAFVERLDQAASLDSSNKEAAMLVATYFSERSNDAIGRLELTINVLLADPVDPNIHVSVAEQLARLGSFEQAERFHLNARSLLSILGQASTPSIQEQSIALRWQNSGPEEVLAGFERRLGKFRRDATELIRRQEELGESTEALQKPEDIRLSVEEERFRLLAAVAIGDRVLAERSVADIDASVEPIIEAIQQRLGELGPADEAERVALVQRAVELSIEAVTSKLIANVRVNEAIATLREIQRLYGASLGDQLMLLQAFATMRSSIPEQAAQAFSGLESRSILGAVGSAMTAELMGENRRALELYERVARFSPLSSAGVFAKSNAERLLGRPLAEEDQAADAGSVAAAVPEWVDLASRRPRSMFRLDARLVEQTLGAFDEARIRIELRNLLPRPIGVGGDRPIATRFALAPDLSAGAFPIALGLSPEVIDIHHKLRLKAGESLVAEVWPDPGQIGWIQEVKAAHRIRGRWNAMQGFVAGQGVPFSTGPLALSSETGLFVRRPSEDVLLDGAQLARNATAAGEKRLFELLPAFRSSLIDVDRPGGGPLDDADATALATALAQRYPGLPADLRLAMAAVLPTGAIRPVLQDLDAVLLAETDPRVLSIVLMTRVRDSAAPVLARAEASSDERLSLLAERLRSRLESGVRTGVAFLGPPAGHLPPPREDEEAERNGRR